MAKRFITTEIFSDTWFMDLPNKYKLFWIFLITDCDHAGIWQVNYKRANFYVGEHLEPNECERFLRDRIIKIENSKYWFIPKFIEFQYGNELKENNPATKSVISLLRKNNLFDFLPKIKIIQGATKELQRSLQAPKDKDKDKEEDKDKEIGKMIVKYFGRNPTEGLIEELNKLIKKYNFDAVNRAMHEAMRQDKKSLSYVEAILKNKDDKTKNHQSPIMRELYGY